MAEALVETVEKNYVHPNEIIERAQSIVSFIRENQEKTEAKRSVPENVFDEILKQGFFKMLMPRRYGGYEHGMDTFAEVAYWAGTHAAE